jgi:16S rRNA (uracil1498-N3)-methyltransferase
MRKPLVFHEGARPGIQVELGSASYHHLARVLKRRQGDQLVVLDGQGGAFAGVVVDVDPRLESIRVQVGDPAFEAAGRISPLVLGLGIPRRDGLETALRWGSEMGLQGLIPLITERSVVRIPPGEPRSGRKLLRWRKIAREAAEQCRRQAPLDVGEPVQLEDLLAREGEFPSRWIAIPGGDRLVESGLPGALSGEDRVLVLVGPEGGFSPAEIDRTLEAGFQPVGFPTPVLRTPTAVAYLAALAGLAGIIGDILHKDIE